jgi:hypothetical protein
MLKKLSVCLLTLGMLVSWRGIAVAYDDQTTHPALTDAAIDFYNLTNPGDLLSDQEREWVVKGSIEEDAAPRWINHFYDPVRKVGWTGDKAGIISPDAVQFAAAIALAPEKPDSAVAWANDAFAQKRYAYYGGDRTWKQGLDSFTEGNREQSYETLGHMLHLLEDMSVPDHTRDDTHAQAIESVTGDEGSPYEEYATQWTRQTIKGLDLPGKLQQEQAAVPARVTVADYLIGVAEYSNKYFFSKDTINDPKYQLPKITKEEGKFVYGTDADGVLFPLAKVDSKISEENILIVSYSIKNVQEHYPILDVYFLHLARQAVLNGAGVIKLFKAQANDAVVNKEFQLTKLNPDVESLVNPPMFSLGIEAGNFTSAIGRAASQFFGAISAVTQAALSAAQSLFTMPMGQDRNVGQASINNAVLVTQQIPQEQTPQLITASPRGSVPDASNTLPVPSGVTAGSMDSARRQLANLLAAFDELQELARTASQAKEAATLTDERSMQHEVSASLQNSSLFIPPTVSGGGGGVTAFSSGGGGGGVAAQTDTTITSTTDTATTTTATSTPSNTTETTPTSTASSTSSSTTPTSTPSSTTPAPVWHFAATPTLAPRIDFSWEPPAGITPSSSLLYELVDITNASSETVLYRTSSSLSWSWPVDEVGRDYDTQLTVRDGDAVISVATTSVRMPNFFEYMYFYRDPRIGFGMTDRYIVDFRASSSRPLWDPSATGQDWKLLVFYLNIDAPKQGGISSANFFRPDDPAVLSFEYRSCNSYIQVVDSLLIPYGSAACRPDGPLSLSYPVGNEQRLIIDTRQTASQLALSTSNFVTIALYDYAGGWEPAQFSLGAIDRTRYYFQDILPPFTPPPAPENLQTSFDSLHNLVTITWNSSPGAASYELQAATSSVLDAAAGWQPIDDRRSGTIGVVYPNTYGDLIATSTVMSTNASGYSPEELMYELPPTTLTPNTSYWIVPLYVDGDRMWQYGTITDSYPDGRWSGREGSDLYFRLRRAE